MYKGKGKSKQERSSMAYDYVWSLSLSLNDELSLNDDDDDEIQSYDKYLKKKIPPDVLREMQRIRDLEFAAKDAAEAAKKGDPDAFTVVLRKIEQDNANIAIITSLSVSVGGKQLVNKASFALSFGKRYRLAGPSGSGKSTLLKLLAWRKIPVPENIDILLVENENVKLSDQNSVLQEVVSANEEVVKFRQEAAALEKNLDSSSSSAYEKLAEWYESPQRLESDAAEAHASKILAGLGFTVEMQNSCASNTFLSADWRMRIALARALFRRPTLLLLDEPTKYLGVRAALWLEEYLCHWDNTLLVVSDQLHFLNTVCTDAFLLHDQDLHIHHGPFKDHEEGPTSSTPEPTKLFPPPPPPCILLTGVSFCYPYRRAGFRLSNVDLCLSMGKRVAVVGPVGAGKSTLLKLFSGDLLPTEGEVTRSQELRIRIYSQHLRRLPPRTKPEAVRAILSKFGLPHSTPFAQLSEKEKARAAVALTVMSKPHILLLDEPTEHLEKETVDVLADELDGFKGALVLVTDDPRLLSRVCENKEKTEFWLVKDGAVTCFPGTSFEEYKQVVLKTEIKAEVGDLITSLAGLLR